MEPDNLHHCVLHSRQVSPPLFGGTGLTQGHGTRHTGVCTRLLVVMGSGEMVDWTQEKIEGPESATQSSDDLSQLLKMVGQAQSVTAELKEPDTN